MSEILFSFGTQMLFLRMLQHGNKIYYITLINNKDIKCRKNPVIQFLICTQDQL